MRPPWNGSKKVGRERILCSYAGSFNPFSGRMLNLFQHLDVKGVVIKAILNFGVPILLLGMLLFLPFPSFLCAKTGDPDSSPGLSASLDRDTARVGDIVTLTLRYFLPQGTRLSVDPEIKGLEGFTIADRKIEAEKIIVKILIDHLGSWKTGPLSLTCLDKDEKRSVLATDPLSLTVSSNLGEKPAQARLKPIQEIIPSKPVWWKYLKWTVVFLGILFFLAGSAWLYRKIRGKNLPIRNEEPPHVRARKKIEELNSQGLFEKGCVKEYYFRFSGILRCYLEALRGFPAAEFTTQEIALHIDNEQDRKIFSLLQHADLVKFADTIPTPAKKEEGLKRALSYIEETIPALEGEKNVSQGAAQ